MSLPTQKVPKSRTHSRRSAYIRKQQIRLMNLAQGILGRQKGNHKAKKSTLKKAETPAAKASTKTPAKEAPKASVKKVEKAAPKKATKKK